MGFNMEKPFCKVISGLTWMETVTNNLLKMANVHMCVTIVVINGLACHRKYLLAIS